MSKIQEQSATIPCCRLLPQSHVSTQTGVVHPLLPSTHGRVGGRGGGGRGEGETSQRDSNKEQNFLPAH